MVYICIQLPFVLDMFEASSFYLSTKEFTLISLQMRIVSFERSIRDCLHDHRSRLQEARLEKFHLHNY